MRVLDRYEFVCSSFFTNEARILCLQTALSFSRAEQYECASQLGDRRAKNEAIAIPPLLPMAVGSRIASGQLLSLMMVGMCP